MDITFKTEEGTFNCRACGLILHDGQILVTQTEKDSHFFLPGGRVQMGESAEDAVLRELREELGIECGIDRCLWLNQAFFNHKGQQFHELCFYFLIDFDRENLLARGWEFYTREGEKENRFLWLPIERLQEAYFFPLFLKTEIFSLPNHLTLRREYQ